MSIDASEVWARCLLTIEKKTTRQSFQTWFRPTKATYFDDTAIIIEVPSSFFSEWLEQNFISLIQSVIFDQTSLTPEIKFTVPQQGQEPQLFSQIPHSQITDRLSEVQETEVVEPLHHLNSRYTFETFVVGLGNQFAHAAAMRVAEAPGLTAFNPLVIYGGVGLGKTHLLQAIGHFCILGKTARNILYVSSEKFFTDFIHSISNKNTEKFAQTYRSADVLLLDDIQFFLHSETTQREFFHTFNTLHQNGKQIVLTSDCPPGELKGLEERLVSRFQWGLVVGIDPPDLETRIAILQSKAKRDGIYLPDDIASFIAAHMSSNIRELEGALIKLLAYSSIKRQDLSMDLAREVIQGISRSSPKNRGVPIDIIQRCVAKHFGLSEDLLISKTRKQEVALARHVAMYLIKKLTDTPLKTIGLHFGGRDHSTVIHACQLVETRIEQDPSFKTEIESLTRTLTL